MTSRAWTEEEKAHLSRLYGEGKTRAEAAEILGRSKSAVANMVWNLGLMGGKMGDGRAKLRLNADEAFVPWTPWREAELVRLTQSGATDEEAARLLMMPVAQVRYRLTGTGAAV